MDKEYIEVKGIKFEKRNKIVRVLVTNRKNRDVFYIESNTNQLQFINVDVSSMKIPQGISYLIENSCVMKVLDTWVLIQEFI